VREVPRRGHETGDGVGYDETGARVVESADTADLKSAAAKAAWGFKSPLGHHNQQDCNQFANADSLVGNLTWTLVRIRPKAARDICKLRHFDLESIAPEFASDRA
jgi:hypothetical protein